MNRIESLAALKTINIARTSVHGVALGVGFFLADAIAILGFERAERSISALTRAGRVNCNSVEVGGTTHDLYFIA